MNYVLSAYDCVCKGLRPDRVRFKPSWLQFYHDPSCKLNFGLFFFFFLINAPSTLKQPFKAGFSSSLQTVLLQWLPYFPARFAPTLSHLRLFIPKSLLPCGWGWGCVFSARLVQVFGFASDLVFRALNRLWVQEALLSNESVHHNMWWKPKRCSAEVKSTPYAVTKLYWSSEAGQLLRFRWQSSKFIPQWRYKASSEGFIIFWD